MTDTIKTLAALDDAALLVKLGYADKLAKAKADLAAADALTGDARKYAETRISSMFTPNVYPDEIGYAVESAVRKANKSAAAEMNACSPCSLCD